MKGIIILLLFVLFAESGSLTFIQKANDKTANKIIDSFIAKQERLTNGQEYKEGRKLLEGKLGSIKSVVVLYTIEGIAGMSNSSQFLAVFASEKSGLVYKAHVQIGGKGLRFARFNSIEDGLIMLDTEEYLSSDALCCPSGKGRAQYAFINDNLIELSTK